MKKLAVFLLTLSFSSTLLLFPAVSVRAGPVCTAASGTCRTACISPETTNLAANDCGGFFCCSLPAAGPWYNQTTEQFRAKVLNTANPDEIFGERYTFAQINWIINSLFIALNPFPNDLNVLQPIIDSIRNLLTQSTPPTFADFAKFGAPGIILGGISEIYSNPPASGIKAISETLDKFDPTPRVHAQGYGFGATTGIQALWRASRNMAYLLMIVLLIAAGFMIMFRVKINPQTAVTLQLMIPKIIITLLLVTFSYAIAGLVIDLIFVLLSFIISLLAFSGAISPNPPVGAITWFTRPNYFQVVLYYIYPWLLMIASGGLSGLVTLVAGPLAPLFAGIGIILAIFGIIATLFLAWLLFKVWWMLVKTYIQFMLYIIIGPWQIMLGILPGQSGFGSWLRNLIAHASVFLTVPLMLALNMFFWDFNIANPIGATNKGSGNFPNFPLFGSKGTIINFAIGYAILALTPKIAEIIRDALKVPPFKYGTAFGEALGPVMGPVGWARSGITGAGQKAFGEAALGTIGVRFGRTSAATTTQQAVGRAGTPPIG